MTSSLTSIRVIGARLTMAMACAAVLLAGCAGTGPEIGRYYPECKAYCDSAKAQWAGPERMEVWIFNDTVKFRQYHRSQKQQEKAFGALRRNVIAARACYNQKWQEVIAQFDSGAISKDETRTRLRDIHANLEHVQTIINDFMEVIFGGLEQMVEPERVLDKLGSGAITRDEAEKRLRALHVEIHGDLDQVKAMRAKTIAGSRETGYRELRDAQDERLKAAGLYNRYRKGFNIDDVETKKKLLLESRRILKDILIKYPNIEIASKVSNNIEQVEQEIRSIDPNLLQHTDQPQVHLTEQGQPLTALHNADRKEEARHQRESSAGQKTQAKAEQQLPAMAKSESNPTPNRRPKNGGAVEGQQRSMKNTQMDTQPITTSEAQLDSDYSELKKSLDDLYHADDERAIQRKYDASARGMEL